MSDRLLQRGVLDARIIVAVASPFATVVLFLPALLLPSLIVAMPLFVLAGATFAARNPALDAARLDIMHHRLWGRAEAVRTLLRQLTVAIAPLLFGFIADQLATHQRGGSAQHGFGASASAPGLKIAFVILLVTVLASGILTLWARRTYPVDVATAAASEHTVRAVG